MSEFKGNQKAVVEHEKGNLLVSASAGSGKTFTMISRAVRLIRERKTKVSRLVALTFTEAAALEMKEKLKKALFELIVSGGEEFTEQISELDCADISTLHAFCGRVIREYFFACGVAPDFRILDANEAMEIKTTAINNLFKRLYEQKDGCFLQLLAKFKQGRKDENLKELVLTLYEKISGEIDYNEILSKYDSLYTIENLDNSIMKIKAYYNDRMSPVLSELAYALDVFNGGEREKAVAVTKTLYEDILNSVKGDFFALKKYKNYPLSFSPSPFGRNLSEEEKTAREIVKASKEAFVSSVERFSKDIADRQTYIDQLDSVKELSKSLSELIKAFCVEYESVKREENALDFSDLEHFCVKVLKNQEIKEEIKAKYDYIFVDEYQDTNSVQELILTLISNNNLFMVGDDKQSIYGFRGCRPEIFTEKEKNLPSEGGSALRLNYNFRSAKNVIDAVNTIFAFSMKEEYYGYSYREKAMLSFGGTYPEGADGRVELHLLDTSLKPKEQKEKTAVKVYDLKAESEKLLKGEEDLEVEEVAFLIADVIEKEYQKEYYDLKEKKFKPVTPNDVVILSRSVDTNYVSRLVSTLLRLGVNVNSKVSVNALDFPETKTLVKLLELLENFKEDLPLITVMKSVIGNFSDEELYDITRLYVSEIKYEDRKGKGFSEAYEYAKQNASENLKNKIIAFDDYVKELRLVKDFIGAKGVLDKVTEESGFFNAILTLKEGKSICQIVESFISKSVSGDKILTVSEFLDKINGQQKAFSVETSVGENAVRIMTIHASKGLEFPVVIVCGLEHKGNQSDENKEVIYSKENGFITKFYNDKTMFKEETPFRILEKERIRENRIKEELRLFYVALTRASYSLHMIAKCNGDPRKDEYVGSDRYIESIPKSFGASVRSPSEFTLDAQKYDARQILVGKVDEERKAIIKKNLEFSYAFSEDVSVPLKTSVTSTLLLKDKTQDEKKEPINEGIIVNVGAIDDEVATDKTSAERGTVVHKILEHYDFSRNDFCEQVNELVLKGIVAKDLVGELNLEKLEKALSGEILSLVKGRKLYREAPFFANFKASEVLDTNSSKNVLIQGVIDLLLVGDSDAIIIDYKYSKLSAKKLKEKYEKQLFLYEKAVERVLNMKVKEKYLFNVLSGEVIKL